MFPYIIRVWFTHTYPENVSTVNNYTIRGALWSWHAVDVARAAVRVVCALWSGHRGAVRMPLQGAGARCCLRSEWCVQFGARLVALMAARAIPLISLISNTASSQPRSQPAATSQPFSQPPNQQQQLSGPPNQPATHPATQSQPT